MQELLRPAKGWRKWQLRPAMAGEGGGASRGGQATPGEVPDAGGKDQGAGEMQ